MGMYILEGKVNKIYPETIGEVKEDEDIEPARYCIQREM